MLDHVSVSRPGGVGRPRQRPDSLAADKAYSSRANREALRARRIRAVIPEPADQIANRKRKGRRGGRPPAFDPTAYTNRNQVERGFGRRKHWRGLATRFDKLASSYHATLALVETLDWLRSVPDSAIHDPLVTLSPGRWRRSTVVVDRRLRRAWAERSASWSM